jgi:DNA-binding GntR family transcriptional regulator
MAKKVSKIQTTTITQQIVALLKERILNGELIAGQRVWAADLAKEFGVSLIPVKDALLILQGEGLTINVPRRGSIVRQFTLRDVMEHLHVRQIIELDAAKSILGKQNHIDELLEGLSRHNEALGKARDENGGWAGRVIPFEHDHSFHKLFVGACDNRLLKEWYQRLNSQGQVIRLSFWNLGPRGDKTYNEHAAIMKGLEKRDLALTRKALKDHLESIMMDYQQAVDEGNVDLGIVEDGAIELPHGRRQLKNRRA